ncbi:MAG TPA: signal peptidase I [Allosphingosinicella sp.]
MTSETESAAPAAAKPAREPKKESWWSFLRFLLILFIGTLFLRSCIVAPFSIPSGSMLPNLMIGDYLFVSKWPYGYSRYSFPFGIANFDGRIMGSLPERGDIVVFRYPGPRNEDFVKRVIGLPGDRIELRGGHLSLNGQAVGRERIADFIVPVSENSPCRPIGGDTRAVTDAGGQPACSYPRWRETLPGGRGYDTIDQIQASPERCAAMPAVDPCRADNFGPIVVPEGHVFVMGDNRDDSLDGRFPVSQNGVGLLPLDYLQGRALISFFSTDGSAEWHLPWTWFTAARWSRIGQTYP